eukprot:scaffold281389_cov31-Tisochrysis_lutea.AAC.1
MASVCQQAGTGVEKGVQLSQNLSRAAGAPAPRQRMQASRHRIGSKNADAGPFQTSHSLAPWGRRRPQRSGPSRVHPSPRRPSSASYPPSPVGRWRRSATCARRCPHAASKRIGEGG